MKGGPFITEETLQFAAPVTDEDREEREDAIAEFFDLTAPKHEPIEDIARIYERHDMPDELLDSPDWWEWVVSPAISTMASIQKSTDAAAQFPFQLARGLITRTAGEEHVADWLDMLASPLTEEEKQFTIRGYAETLAGKRTQAVQDMGVGGQVANTLINEAAPGLISLMLQMKLLRPQVKAGSMEAIRKMGTLEPILQRMGVLGAHGVATTEDDLADRLTAGAYRIGYNMTPYIANQTGATGLTATAVDTMLNTFLTSPVYKEAYEKSGGIDENFVRMVAPQLLMDVGMAWSTRGDPNVVAHQKLDDRIEQVSKDTGFSRKQVKRMFDEARRDARLGEDRPVEVDWDKVEYPARVKTEQYGELRVVDDRDPSFVRVENQDGDRFELGRNVYESMITQKDLPLPSKVVGRINEQKLSDLEPEYIDGEYVGMTFYTPWDRQRLPVEENPFIMIDNLEKGVGFHHKFIPVRKVLGEGIISPIRTAYRQRDMVQKELMEKGNEIVQKYDLDKDERELAYHMLEGTIEPEGRPGEAAREFRKLYGESPDEGLFALTGLPAYRFLQDYGPHVRDAESIEQFFSEEYFPGGLGDDIKAFYEMHRTGDLEPRETDILESYKNYVGALTKRKYLKPVRDEIEPFYHKMHPDRQKFFDDFWNYVMGRPTSAERLLQKMFESVVAPIYSRIGKTDYKKLESLMEEKDVPTVELARELDVHPSTVSKYRTGEIDMPHNKVKKVAKYLDVPISDLKADLIGRELHQLAMYLSDGLYMGTIGGNLHTPLKNLTQPALTVGELSPDYPMQGLKDVGWAKKAMMTEQGRELLEHNWVGEHRIYLEGLENEKKILDRVMGPVKDSLFSFFKWSDKHNVNTAFLAGYKHAVDRGQSQAEAIEFGNQVALKTQFGYGLDSPLFFKSPGGRLGGMFSSWWLNWASNLYEDAADSEAFKIASGIISLTLASYAATNITGVDFSNVMPHKIAHRPLSMSIGHDLPPMASIVSDTGQLLDDFVEGRSYDILYDSADHLKSQLALFLPGTVQRRRIERFLDTAVNDWVVYDERSRREYEITPGEGFRSLFGTTVEQKERWDFYREEGELRRRYTNLRTRAVDAFIDGNMEEFEDIQDKLIDDFSHVISTQDIKQELEMKILSSKERFIQRLPRGQRIRLIEEGLYDGLIDELLEN